MTSRSKQKREYKQSINPPTILQKMAREVNYILGFRLSHLHIRPLNFPTSDKTERAITLR